ncbi:MAG: hypothetical protein FWD71_08045 [Oscillospiraceae bacterium]|nr:hypothetical protein [Oscillospiraceae bacterium]
MELSNQRLQEEVKGYIITVLKDEFYIDLNPDINGDENFFNHKINLSARNMVYLFFLSEKHYDICFTEKDIDSLSFYTFNGLRDIIVNHIKTRCN